jgi:hypothetical protein
MSDVIVERKQMNDSTWWNLWGAQFGWTLIECDKRNSAVFKMSCGMKRVPVGMRNDMNITLTALQNEIAHSEQRVRQKIELINKLVDYVTTVNAGLSQVKKQIDELHGKPVEV